MSDQRANWWFGILVGGPMFAFLFFLLMHTNSQETERGNCLQRGGELQTVRGTLRQAGPDFFVVNNRWRRFASPCAGKRRQERLQRYPGIALLEQHIGAEVSVTFCEQSMVGYSVAGQVFGVPPAVSE